ncbi:hypothetical protein DFH27DRAFT_614239 [Peziza echinospora]|nr:hypothetical protein DFH27DRAFT_614239 [Peziza echinospora]
MLLGRRWLKQFQAKGDYRRHTYVIFDSHGVGHKVESINLTKVKEEIQKVILNPERAKKEEFGLEENEWGELQMGFVECTNAILAKVMSQLKLDDELDAFLATAPESGEIAVEKGALPASGIQRPREVGDEKLDLPGRSGGCLACGRSGRKVDTSLWSQTKLGGWDLCQKCADCCYKSVGGLEEKVTIPDKIWWEEIEEGERTESGVPEEMREGYDGYDEDRRLCVFTDGSVLRNRSMGALGGAGMWISEEDSRNQSITILIENVTNQKAELVAIETALRIT